jgi:hypothetical protein
MRRLLLAGLVVLLAAAGPALARPRASTATTPISTLERHPETKLVMDAFMPNLTKHPAYPRFSNMSLKQLQDQDPRITDQTLERIDAALAAAQAPPSVETTPIFLLAGSPGARDVLNSQFPGLTGHPNYPKFRFLSLKELQGFDPRITDSRLAAIQSGLDAAQTPPTPAP